MAGDQAQFFQLLNTLLSPENDIRSQAEEAYNNIPTETKVAHLVGAVQNPGLGEEGRQTAAVLLRRLLSSEFFEFFPKLPEQEQNMLKEQLLLTLQMDVTQPLRRKICDVVSELARNLLDEDGNNQWPEFLQFMIWCAGNRDTNVKEAAIRMFTSVPGVFGNLQAQNLDVIKGMLLSGLQPDGEEALRVQAAKAVGAFILLHDKEPAIQKHFADLLVPFVAVVMQTLESGEDDAAIKVLIELAESAPKFLRPQLDNIFQLCLKVVGDAEAEETWRQLALEVVVTYAETAPATVRKHAFGAVRALVPLLLDMMAELEEDEEWAARDEQPDEEQEEAAVAGESALDRLCCALGGRAMLAQVVERVPALLASPDWRRRHAALMAVSAAGEGCHRQMEAVLDQVTAAVLTFLRDPHPRVRYAACNAVGQMSTDFAPVFQKKFHDKVVEGLLLVLDDDANPRVQAHAAAALVNFSEDCPKNILKQYLEPLMAKLEQILTSKFKELVERGTKLVLEQVVTTIASVADTVERDFGPHYARLMPALQYIIANANSDDLRMLRGKTVECVSLVGLAVGPDVFLPDAPALMDLLLRHQGQPLPQDDPQTSFLIAAWSRVCKVMGKRFAPYLPAVMEPVMRTAGMKPEVALLDNEDLDEVEADLDWQFVTLGEQQNFGIKTAGLEDKAAACDMLVAFARELKEDFANYVEDVVKLMVPMLKFYFHDGVRIAAAESLPHLLECAKIRGQAYVGGMWAYVLPELLKAADSEPEADVRAELLSSLAQCVDTLGAGCLHDDAAAELGALLLRLLESHFERAADRTRRRQDDEHDEAAEDELADEDGDDALLLARLADVLHALLATHGAAWFPRLDPLVPSLGALLAPGRPAHDRQWALCVFDDAVEYGGADSARYADAFVEPLLAALADPAPEVRQAAAYGAGVLALRGGPAFAPACARAVPLLRAACEAPDARDPRNLPATENCVSALAKILRGEPAPDPDAVRRWLSYLPVLEDADEAPHVYGLVCELARRDHPALADREVRAGLVPLLAEVLSRGVLPADSGVRGEVCALLRTLQGDADAFAAGLRRLNAEQSRALQEALSA